MHTQDLIDRLKVGTKVRIGKEYADFSGLEEGKVITLVEGNFEHDNGLYTEYQTAPSIWNSHQGDYDSIFHLFGNRLEYFKDCTILGNE